MADFDSTSYIQRRNLDDFPANITLLQNFSSKLIFYFRIFGQKSCFRIFGQKVYPGKWYIPEYPNIASPPPPLVLPTIKHVSVPNLKSFGQTKTELRAKEVGEFSIMLYWKMGWWTFSCPPTWLLHYKKTSKTLNSRNVCIYWCMYRPETCRDFSKWGYLPCVKMLCRKSLINFNFYDFIANHE